MIDSNPYKSPDTPTYIDPAERRWLGGADSVVAIRGMLHRKVIINRPVEVTIEYFARSLRDRILVDGKTAVSVLPILRLTERFDFTIPYCDGHLPASVFVKTERRSLKLSDFEIEINGVVPYRERAEQQVST